jgi:hypothetical protein
MQILHPDGGDRRQDGGKLAGKCGDEPQLVFVPEFVRGLAMNKDRQAHVDRNGLIVQSCGTETEFVNRFGHFSAQFRVEGLDDLDIRGNALVVDVQLQDNFRIVRDILSKCSAGEGDAG